MDEGAGVGEVAVAQRELSGRDGCKPGSARGSLAFLNGVYRDPNASASASAAYFPIAAARPSGSATLTHSREWSRNPMTLGILSTNAIHNPL